MEINLWTEFALLILLLVLSAFFSGSETALFSLSEPLLQGMKEEKKRSSSLILKLLGKPRRLLITILTGNTIVNIAIASLAALMAADLSHRYHFSRGWAIFFEVVVVTFIILILSEITPKTVAIKNPQGFSRRVVYPLRVMHVLLFPISIILTGLAQLVSKGVVSRHRGGVLSEEELRSLVELGEAEGVLEEDEREMIHSIFEFGETMVREIMVPRMDMVCVNVNIKLQELLEIFRQEGHSRIPVYEGKIDNIKGLIYAKDLLPYLGDSGDKFNLRALLREAYFIPESKKIDELLREFQQRKIHMAVVVDEYGGTLGLVTLEDIIEEIVGEIQDEYDQELPPFRRIDEHTVLADAKVSVHELNEELDFNIPESGDYESLGGFICSLTGSVPEEGTSIEHGDLGFLVEKVSGRRIEKVRIVHKKQGKESNRGMED
ncbi:HlyC/CorC family transporter [candidate division KSB1 bacterium]|nr:HlyC/CorC family transporter [candidate division KSB1 bacterium]